MASLSRDKQNRFRLQFVVNKKRYAIRITNVSRRQADLVRMYVERMISSHKCNLPLDDATSLWLAKAHKSITTPLAAAGLISQSRVTTLEDLLEYNFEQARIKHSTLLTWKNCQRNLLMFFDPKRSIADITAGDVEEFRRWMEVDQQLSSATVSKRCQQCRQFFGMAVKKKWLNTNPFAGMRGWVDYNPDRQVFISQDLVERVIDACPNVQWKLILALSRYGGLRCPSEVFAVQWSGIDWDRMTMVVPSPKTERFAHKSFRVIPIFPEIVPHLSSAWSSAVEGDDKIIRWRKTSQALRSDMIRICKRAGVPVWPKLFQNLRASRETELMDRFPLHVVCTWIGNTPRIAQRHYLQVTDDHIASAISGAPSRDIGCKTIAVDTPKPDIYPQKTHITP